MATGLGTQRFGTSAFGIGARNIVVTVGPLRFRTITVGPLARTRTLTIGPLEGA